MPQALLSNGHDTHAFNRMDELIVEMNLDFCDDKIEEYCEFIGKQLQSLQKMSYPRLPFKGSIHQDSSIHNIGLLEWSNAINLLASAQERSKCPLFWFVKLQVLVRWN